MPGTENIKDQVMDRIEVLSKQSLDTVKALHSAYEKRNSTAIKALEDKLAGVGAELATLQTQEGNLKRSLAHLEARPNYRSDKQPVSQTLMGMFWGSPEMRAFRSSLKGGDGRGAAHIGQINLGSFFGMGTRQAEAMHRLDMELRSSPTHDDGSIGDWVKPWFSPKFIDLPQAMPILRELIDVVPVTSDSVQIDREKRWATPGIRLTADASPTDTTAALEDVSGLSTAAPFNQITFTQEDETNSQTVTITGITALVVTFTPALVATHVYLAPTATTDGALVHGLDFIETPEGALAPVSQLKTELYNVPIMRLAHVGKVTLQKLADIVQFESWLRRRMLSTLGRVEAVNGYYNPGTNAAPGIFVDTDVIAASTSLGALSTQTAGTSIIDYMMAAFYVLAAKHYIPTTAILSPKAHEMVANTKDSQKRYIYFINDQPGTPPRVHLVDVRLDTQLQPNDSVMSDFNDTMTMFDREQSTLDIGTEEDDLRRGKRTVVAALRSGLGIELPSGVQLLDVDTLP